MIKTEDPARLARIVVWTPTEGVIQVTPDLPLEEAEELYATLEASLPLSTRATIELVL